MAIGETISHWLWDGPGASTWHAASTALTQVVSQITGIQGGQQANSGVLLASWASPTGEKAVTSNTPYQAWLAQAGTQIQAAATQIASAGATFHTVQGATPTPAQFAANHTEFVSLMHGVPFTIPQIMNNRLQYMMYTLQAVTSYFMWSFESTSLMGALQPLPPPPVTAVPNPGLMTPLSAGQAPPAVGLPSAAAAVPAGLGALPSMGSAAVQPISALSQLLSGNGLLSSGGQSASAPSAMTSGLGSLPSMASAPMSAMTSGLGSPSAGSGGAGANPGSWLGGMPADGGTVAAALSSGGAGTGGFGGAAAMAPMRGPVSWASSANAANPTSGTDQVVVSRFAEARAASATSSGMGAPGTMMPPGRQGSAKEEQESDATLASAAAPYRVPRNMPVVTGANGAQIVAGEEEDRYQIL